MSETQQRHTPTDDSAAGSADRKNLSVRLDGEESLKLKALAYDYGGCSQSAVIREYIAEHYDQVFGDLDPDAVDRGTIPDAQLRQIINGADAADVVDEEYLIDTDSDDDTDDVATSDGGVMVSPGSYSMTLGPVELAQSGPELTWDKLRDVVADDGHWSDELVIHPDRVPADELKSSHKYTPRIVVAMLRHKANEYGLVPGAVVSQTIDEYLVGFHDRVDETAGQSYIHNTYRPLIENHLYETPSPVANGYFTTLGGQAEAAESIVDSGLMLPIQITSGDELLDIDRYHETVGHVGRSKQTIEQWKEHVAAMLESVAEIQGVVSNMENLDLVAAEYPDQYDHLAPFLKDIWTKWCDNYLEAIPDPSTRNDIEHRVDDDALDLLQTNGI